MANYVASFTYDDTNQIRNILPKPANTPSSGNDYVAADGTYKTIPTVTSGAILAALGYTPANDASVLHTSGNETKTGNLTVTGSITSNSDLLSLDAASASVSNFSQITHRGDFIVGGNVSSTAVRPVLSFYSNGATYGRIDVTSAGDFRFYTGSGGITGAPISAGAATFTGKVSIPNQIEFTNTYPIQLQANNSSGSVAHLEITSGGQTSLALGIGSPTRLKFSRHGANQSLITWGGDSSNTRNATQDAGIYSPGAGQIELNTGTPGSYADLLAKAATFSSTVTLSGVGAIGSANSAGASFTTGNLNILVGCGNQGLTNGNRISVFGAGNIHNSGASSAYHSVVGYANSISGGTISNVHVLGSSNTVTADNSVTIGNSITNGSANTVMIGPNNAAKLTIDSTGGVTVRGQLALNYSGTTAKAYVGSSFTWIGSSGTNFIVGINDAGGNNARMTLDTAAFTLNDTGLGIRIGTTASDVGFFKSASVTMACRTATNGADAHFTAANITSSALLRTTSDKLQIDTPKTPLSASDTGTLGQICWDSNYVYVCVGTNSWKRSALSTW